MLKAIGAVSVRVNFKLVPIRNKACRNFKLICGIKSLIPLITSNYAKHAVYF